MNGSGDLKRLESELAHPADARAMTDSCREVLRILRTIRQDPNLDRWRKLARIALVHLGGDADRSFISMRDYDHAKYGPYLGVSDEGSAAEHIYKAGLDSPKARVLGTPTPMELGLALDLERLGAVGEVVVGPDEYADVWTKCAGRLLMSTNVGTRANLRFYSQNPLVKIPFGTADRAVKTVTQKLLPIFEPFFNTPDKRPRPRTALVEFDPRYKSDKQKEIRAILAGLVRALADSKKIDPAFHKIALNLRIGWGTRFKDKILRAIDMVKDAGIKDIFLDGVTQKDADRTISMPGILNYLPPQVVQPVLEFASKSGVTIRSHNTADPDTVARGIWSCLNTARNMGLDLGKYGLFPLTLEDSRIVTAQVQKWFENWSAAPVFFVDQGLLTATDVYVESTLVDGLIIWLKEMKESGIKIVLIDTMDKSKGRRLLKEGNDTRGLLTQKQIMDINELATSLGIKVLWAGGITLAQTFLFGKMGVFGVYITTATASAKPVSGVYVADPELAAVKEPTYDGVLHVKLLLEAGFLVSQLSDMSKVMEKESKELVKAVESKKQDDINSARDKLYSTVLTGWKKFWWMAGQ
jgi:hypothetical protein